MLDFFAIQARFWYHTDVLTTSVGLATAEAVHTAIDFGLSNKLGNIQFAPLAAIAAHITKVNNRLVLKLSGFGRKKRTEVIRHFGE